MTELTFQDLQRQMQLGKQSKQGVNFTFRNAEQIYNKFKELDSGWILTATDELFAISDRLFVKATATARKGDEIHEATAYAELDKVPVFKTGNKQMQDPQWTGAVSSYARKYALQGLFAIGEKDVDEYTAEGDQQQGGQGQQSTQEPQPKAELINQVQRDEIYKKVHYLAQLKGVSFDQVANFLLNKYQISDFGAIQVKDYGLVSQNIDNMIKKAEGQKNGQRNEP